MPVKRMRSGDETSPGADAARSHPGIAHEGREALRELSRALAAARRMTDAGDALVRDHLRQSPYGALGLVAAAGYVLGAGVPGWAASAALRLGGRVLLLSILQDRLFGDEEAPVTGEP